MNFKEIFLGNFKNRLDVANSFSGYSSEPSPLAAYLKDAIIYIAWYGDGSYCGSAVVVYEKPEGTLYWVTAYHCSCSGLEDQWEPIETDWATLRHVYENGYQFNQGGEYDASEELHEQMGELLKEHAY
jgi:hypothetical protein